MPKKARALSALEVGRIRAKGMHAVGGVGGLHLRVTPSGARGWILRVRVGGKRRDIGLGGFPDVTLATARDKARAAHERITDGGDVVAERRAARQALMSAQAARMTFAEAARAKWATLVPEFRSKKHQMDWISSLERYAFKDLGSIDVSEIELPHVLRVLQPIWQTKTETATRVRQRIQAVLDWATVAGHRTGSNPARWDGNLAEVLPKPSKITKETHQPALSWQDVPRFMRALRKRQGTAARALELAILTAARSGELRGMTWAEVDSTIGVWKVPGERMKTGKPHAVPLSARAQELIQAQPRIEESPYVFAAIRGGTLSDMSISAVCRRMGVAAVPHGFRSSFKDWARSLYRDTREGLVPAYADEVSELALAHVNSDATRAAYARDELLPLRTRLMEEWGAYCDGAASTER